MNEFKIPLRTRARSTKTATVRLVGAGWEIWLARLLAEGLELEVAAVLRAVFIARLARTLDCRSYFDGAGWGVNAMEIHLPGEAASQFAAKAIDAYLEHWADHRRFSEEWLRIELELQRGRVAFDESYSARRFPRFDAPLAKIPKKRPGEFRTIAIPALEQKRAARWMLPVLAGWIDDRLPLHGFVQGRNPVTNAKVHLNFRWSLCFDLEDFFDCVTVEKLVASGLPTSLAEAITDAEGIARQGYPTSPSAANIAFQAVDRRLLKQLEGREGPIAYSRYADDLTFSANDRNSLEELRPVVERIIQQAGFKVSHRKTHWWSADAGRRVITGVAVGADLRAPREIRRRLRAATHQRRMPQMTGLAEWNQMKEPRFVRPVV